MTRLLILGGTAEAASLARKLEAWPDLRVVTSLAGCTKERAGIPGEIRVGGFGGIDGLVAFIERERIDVLIDATHPFAEQMSNHAVTAAEQAAIPRLRLLRPPWKRKPGDRWVEVDDAEAAARVLPGLAKRVFLTTGHHDLEAFAKSENIWFLIRTIEPVAGPRPEHVCCLRARGPFDEADEIALMREHRIDAVVTKASGGEATYAKISAARKLGLPVIMIKRPPPPPGPTVQDTEAALTWLRQVRA